MVNGWSRMQCLRLAQCFLVCAAVAAGDLAAGKFLVASRDLHDPNFRESVVLLTRYSPSGAMGLIVNRPTKLTVKRFVPTASAAQVVYFGGPVELGALLLLQAGESKAGWKVLPGVYLVTDPDAIAETLTGGNPKRVRAFAGYAGWGPGQLDGEMLSGSWHVFPGDAKLVFDADPESVWEKLIRRTELLIAGLRRR
jgi:putative transcriptional regulator